MYIGERFLTYSKNRMGLRIITQSLHALFGQNGDDPLVERRDYRLPPNGGARIKSFLPFAGQTMIEHLHSLCREIFAEILLVTNEPEAVSHLNVDVVKDILPYRGPLGGILSGLLVSKNDSGAASKSSYRNSL